MLKTESYAKRWSRATVAISACLILLSTSCGVRTPSPPAPPKLIFVYPPAVLLQQCEQTPFTGFMIQWGFIDASGTHTNNAQVA